MINGLIYRLTWKNFEGVTVVVDIADTLVQIEDDETPQIISLTPAGAPLDITVMDNDKNKFTPIKAKGATIRFLSDNNYDITTFATGPDNRWFVTITAGGSTLFLGYLVLGSMSEQFLPVAGRIIVSLTASDHLALLRDVELTDLEGDVPRWPQRIADWLTWALAKTGLSLQLNVVDNLRHGTGEFTDTVSFTGSTILLSDETNFFYSGQIITITGTASNNGTYHVTGEGGIFMFDAVGVEETFVTESNVEATFQDVTSLSHYYDLIHLDAKTFEGDLGKMQDCRTVLEKILGNRAFVTQFNGAWWIRAIDEYDANPVYYGIFNTDGSFQQMSLPQLYQKDWGRNQTIKFIEASQVLYIHQEHNKVRLTHNFETPKEIIENGTFTRGELSTSGTLTGYELSDIEDWDLRNNFGVNEDAPTTTAHITRKYDGLDDVIEKFAVLLMPPAANELNYIVCQPINLHYKDKFTVSVEYSADVDNGVAGDTTINAVLIVLYADNGDVYILGGDDVGSTTIKGQWYLSNTDLTVNFKPHKWQYNATNQDISEWQSYSVDSDPLPANGKLMIHLFAGNQNADTTADNFNMRFSNLSFAYNPYIQGTYREHSGLYHEDSRSETGYFTKWDEQVYLTDGVKKLYKGAMQFISNYNEVLTDSVSFVAPDTFLVPGTREFEFPKGKKIRIESASNTGNATVVSSTYHIIGDSTEIVVSGLTITTVTETATILEAAFNLANRFYTSHVFSLGNPPGVEYCKHYGEQQSVAVWNQVKQAKRRIEARFLGYGSEWPDLIYNFNHADINPNTDNKFFLLTGFTQDWKSCQWEGTLIELFNIVDGKTYEDPHAYEFIEVS